MSEDLIAGIPRERAEIVIKQVDYFNHMYFWHGSLAMEKLRSLLVEDIKKYLLDDEQDFSIEARQEKAAMLDILYELELCFSARPDTKETMAEVMRRKHHSPEVIE